jgi:hypothetical protein
VLRLVTVGTVIPAPGRLGFQPTRSPRPSQANENVHEVASMPSVTSVHAQWEGDEEHQETVKALLSGGGGEGVKYCSNL